MRVMFNAPSRYPFAVNLEYVESWKVEAALHGGKVIPESKGFFIRLNMTSGKELLIGSNEGAKELLEVLQDSYACIFGEEYNPDEKKG